LAGDASGKTGPGSRERGRVEPDPIADVKPRLPTPEASRVAAAGLQARVHGQVNRIAIQLGRFS